MRVLYVEDDDDCREALSAELGDHGVNVESFRDGTSMLERLLEFEIFVDEIVDAIAAAPHRKINDDALVAAALDVHLIRCVRREGSSGL